MSFETVEATPLWLDGVGVVLWPTVPDEISAQELRESGAKPFEEEPDTVRHRYYRDQRRKVWVKR